MPNLVPLETQILPSRLQELLAAPVIPDELHGPEEISEYVGALIKEHCHRIKEHFYSLGPLLLKVRQERLWQFDANYHGSFAEWLEQPEIELSLSRANDIISWHVHALPLLAEAGFTPEEVLQSVDESKIRMLVPHFRDAMQRRQRALKDLQEENPEQDPDSLQAEANTLANIPDMRALIEQASHATVQDLRLILRSHKPDDETPLPDLPIRVQRTPSGHWNIGSMLNAAQMDLLNRRARPIWLDRAGNPAARDWEEQEEGV
jgi:hypothetical protein